MSDPRPASLRSESLSDAWTAALVRARIHRRLPDPPAPMRPSRRSAVHTLMAGLFVVGIGVASSQDAGAAAPTSSAGPFKLFSMDCDEDEEGLDTTPQSPPLDVDDPGTPGCNTLEANFVFSGEFAGRSKSLEIPLLDLNFGIGDNLQLKYEVPFIWNREDEEDDEEEGGGRVTTTTTGFGNSEIGVKWMFLDDSERSLEAALYPQVEFKSSSRAVEREGPADEGTVLTLPILVSKRLASTSKGDVMLSANVAYDKVFGSRDSDVVFAALGIGAPLFSPRIAVMGEIVTEQATSRDEEGVREHLIKMDLAVKAPITNHISAFATVGRSLDTSEDHPITYRVLGVQVVYGFGGGD